MVDALLILVAAGGNEPAALGLDSYQWVSIAMLILLGLVVWKKVPGLITGGLDSKIQQIKDQLDEAKNLRAEAEALRDEYAAKLKDAEKHAEAMLENAERDAESILKKAEADGKLMVERRKRMAEDKIAAAEREAVDEVKAVAVGAAAAAARKLIAENHGADADKKLADEVISSI
jgi:F-type H+-transporting ATPase subunit b